MGLLQNSSFKQILIPVEIAEMGVLGFGVGFCCLDFVFNVNMIVFLQIWTQQHCANQQQRTESEADQPVSLVYSSAFHTLVFKEGHQNLTLILFDVPSFLPPLSCTGI